MIIDVPLIFVNFNLFKLYIWNLNRQALKEKHELANICFLESPNVLLLKSFREVRSFEELTEELDPTWSKVLEDFEQSERLFSSLLQVVQLI